MQLYSLEFVCFLCTLLVAYFAVGRLFGRGQWIVLLIGSLGFYMATGWQHLDGSWYHLGANGAMTTGWLKDGPSWFYLHGNGSMATGWELIGWTWYHFAPSGAWIG